MKELFIAAHEELIQEYLEKNPTATEAEAYEATADLVQNRYIEKFASLVDAAQARMEDR